MGSIPKAQARAVQKYKKEHYDTVTVRVKKGISAKWKLFAYRHGYESLNQFVVEAVDEKIDRMKDMPVQGDLSDLL